MDNRFLEFLPVVYEDSPVMNLVIWLVIAAAALFFLVQILPEAWIRLKGHHHDPDAHGESGGHHEEHGDENIKPAKKYFFLACFWVVVFGGALTRFDEYLGYTGSDPFLSNPNNLYYDLSFYFASWLAILWIFVAWLMMKYALMMSWATIWGMGWANTIRWVLGIEAVVFFLLWFLPDYTIIPYETIPGVAVEFMIIGALAGSILAFVFKPEAEEEEETSPASTGH